MPVSFTDHALRSRTGSLAGTSHLGSHPCVGCDQIRVVSNARLRSTGRVSQLQVASRPRADQRQVLELTGVSISRQTASPEIARANG